VQVAFQTFGRRQTVKDVFFLFGRKAGLAADAFELLLPPALLRHVGGVHVLGADGAAVGLAQRVQQLAQAHAVLAEEGVGGVEHGFLVGIGETVKGRLEFGNVRALGALQGVQIGPALAHVAVGGNQLLHGSALATHLGVGAGHDHLGAALLGTLGKSIDHRQVGNILGVGAIDGRNVLEGVEIFAPVVGNAAWVGQVVLVHFLDVRAIAPEEMGVGRIGREDRLCLTHFFRYLRSPSGNISWLNYLPRHG